MPSQYLRLALGLIFLHLSARIPSGSANVAKILSMFSAAKSTRIGQSESRQREVNSVKVNSVEVNSVEVNSVEVKKPHIFIILADDLGWNDVSFHGANQIPTPNIDALAYNGVILNSHYVSALCTPSRAALMTGKYPIRTGMQHYVLYNSEPRGLPLNEKLLPEYMRDAGYRTHAIGKWHLGFHKREYTPTYRGFDSHFGYWTAFQDYYSHQVFYKLPKASGIDMRRNMSVAWDTEGKYSTDLFTEEAIRLIEEHDTRSPMFMYLAHLAVHIANTPNRRYAPDDEIAKFSYIEDPGRRTYAAMVSKMDASVGAVTEALSRRGMLNNSIILFMSDNGAQSIGSNANNGSNYPLRGMKNSAWEGGVRGAAAIWSPLIKNPRRVSNQLMSITDWLPTFWSAAGMDVNDLGTIDGVDAWQSLISDKTSSRSEVLINIDDISDYSAIRRGDFKYVFGQADTNNDWYGDSGRNDLNQSSLSESYLKSVLSSEAGLAISRLTTSGQVMKSQNHSNDDSVKILTTDDIRRLRFDAEIRCNGSEKWKKVVCDPVKSPCLFNIKEDPCEYVNLAKKNPTILDTLENVLEKYRATAIPEANVPTDPLSNPDLWGGVWVNWKDSDPLVITTKNN